jgi:RNA polymerase sigma-54 factor
VPDVFVRPAPDGAWLVELNSDTLPKVLVNQSYYAEVSATTRRDTEKSYLADCLQSATWLVRALDQRARTILKVSNEIVRQQDAFFARGVQHLRSRPWPKPLACMNRRCRASPPTNTWRRAAAFLS